jgi:hypothetical protein
MYLAVKDDKRHLWVPSEFAQISAIIYRRNRYSFANTHAARNHDPFINSRNGAANQAQQVARAYCVL